MSTTNGHRRWRFLAVVIAIVALNVLFAAPASADGCDVPLPERPGDGLVGTIDLPKTDRGNPVDSAYGKYSYAGSTWHTYTTGSACSLPSGMSDLAHPWDQTDTRLGNQLFDVGKGFVAVHNDLWYTLHSQDSPLGWLDPQIKHLAQVMYNGPFTVFLGVVLVLVAGVVLTLIITGNLAQVMAKSAGILAGLWLAGTAITMPLVYTTLVDGLMYDTVGGLQTQALGHGQHDPQDAIPDLLYNKVIGDTWAQGEFGDTQSPLAQKYGAELLDSQAWRKSDVSQDPTTDQKRLQDKQNEYKDVANKLQNTDAWPYFTDTSDSRVGVGALGALRGIAYTTFPIFAEFGQFLATALIRVLVITAPLLGLFMLLQHRMAFRLARGLGHAFGACLFLALGSVVYLLLVQAVLAANAPTFIQIMFLAIATLIALITVRPIQQMKTILGGMMTAAGMENAGNTVTNGRFFSREWWRQHRLAKTMQSQLGAERRTAAGVDRTADGVNRRREEWLTPQNPDDFLPPPHLRKRPEGNTNDTDAADSKPIQATAERLDQEPRGPIRATATRTDRPPAGHNVREHGPRPEAAGDLGPRIIYADRGTYHQPPSPATDAGGNPQPGGGSDGSGGARTVYGITDARWPSNTTPPPETTNTTAAGGGSKPTQAHAERANTEPTPPAVYRASRILPNGEKGVVASEIERRRSEGRFEEPDEGDRSGDSGPMVIASEIENEPPNDTEGR